MCRTLRHVCCAGWKENHGEGVAVERCMRSKLQLGELEVGRADLKENPHAVGIVIGTCRSSQSWADLTALPGCSLVRCWRVWCAGQLGHALSEPNISVCSWRLCAANGLDRSEF